MQILNPKSGIASPPPPHPTRLSVPLTTENPSSTTDLIAHAERIKVDFHHTCVEGLVEIFEKNWHDLLVEWVSVVLCHDFGETFGLFNKNIRCI